MPCPLPSAAGSSSAPAASPTPLAAAAPGEPDTSPDAAHGLRPKLRRLRPAELHPHPLHRPAVTKAKRLRFAEALDAAGYLAPLLVCPRAAGGYTLIDGHHRLEHARHRGLARVDCLVISVNAEQARCLRSVIDSFVPMADPVKEAELLQACVEDRGAPAVSRQTGLSRAALRRRMRTQPFPPRPRTARPSLFSPTNPQAERSTRVPGYRCEKKSSELEGGIGDMPNPRRARAT